MEEEESENCIGKWKILLPYSNWTSGRALGGGEPQCDNKNTVEDVHCWMRKDENVVR